ncbi:MAG: cytochrome c oxidase subunit [Solirubrobacterales bacterium]|nr:cytochrome c oxidase subunit [Solirubrobacterales bacterium]
MDTRHEFGDLTHTYLPIAVAVVVVVLLLVVGFALRYRARPGRPAPSSRRSEAPRLEIAYVLALTAVAAFLLTRTFPVEGKVDRVVAHPGLEVHAIAGKWRWRFDYPAQHRSQVGTETAPTTLVVPTGATVRFTLTSVDVIHAMWIPGERIKRDAFPGRIATFDVVFGSPGFSRYGGECSEFCGLGHTDMRFSIRVLAPAQFRAWAGSR